MCLDRGQAWVPNARCCLMGHQKRFSWVLDGFGVGPKWSYRKYFLYIACTHAVRNQSPHIFRRPRKRVLEKLADRVKRTLKPVEWCLVQQQAAIRKATASSSTGKRLVGSVRDGLWRAVTQGRVYRVFFARISEFTAFQGSASTELGFPGTRKYEQGLIFCGGTIPFLQKYTHDWLLQISTLDWKRRNFHSVICGVLRPQLLALFVSIRNFSHVSLEAETSHDLEVRSGLTPHFFLSRVCAPIYFSEKS